MAVSRFEKVAVSFLSARCQLLLQSQSKFIYLLHARLCDRAVFCRCFDENLYFFELFGLPLICKELALLACRLTIVYPVLAHNMYQLWFQCVRRQRNAALIIFIMSHELWSSVWVDISAGRQCSLVRNQNTTPSQGQAFSKSNDSFPL